MSPVHGFCKTTFQSPTKTTLMIVNQLAKNYVDVVTDLNSTIAILDAHHGYNWY